MGALGHYWGSYGVLWVLRVSWGCWGWSHGCWGGLLGFLWGVMGAGGGVLGGSHGCYRVCRVHIKRVLCRAQKLYGCM